MNYHRDLRVVAAGRHAWFNSIDAAKQTVEVEIYDPSDELLAALKIDDYAPEDEHIVVDARFQWEVCDTCRGKGTHVDPSIDAHGITRDEFDRDPDFEEAYRGGNYDVPCYGCKGRTTVPVLDGEDNQKLLVEHIHAMQKDAADHQRAVADELRYGC